MKRLAATALLACSLGASGADDQPLARLPYTPGLNPASMDTSVSPCEDFYRYACGGWIKNNPIPPDQASWDVYSKMAQDNRRFLWGILDALSRQTEGRTPAQQKIGDLFASCMDEARIEALGAGPLALLLARIDAMRSLKDLPAVLAALHLATGDDGLLFGYDANPDFGDSSRVIAFVGSGGLSLPDRDYYLLPDDKMRDMRVAFVGHVARMLELLGTDPRAAKAQAATVITMETALAKATLTRVEQREPRRLHHIVDAKGLKSLAPAFDWPRYLSGLGQSKVNRFNVTEPAFLKAVNLVLAHRGIDELKVYLRWHLVHAMAGWLSTPFVQENFDFFAKTLRGVPALQPRWQRCVTLVDGQLGEALGKEFVSRAFSPELKRRIQHMTGQIEQAMAREIRSLDWMSPATQAKALEKLGTVVNKVGYPDRWRDYGAVAVRRDDLLGNVQRATEFESRRQLAQIGKPVDRGEWGMTPPTVNAYYHPQFNSINFPAGILQPPLFDPAMDDGPNYGNTGSTIGHELTHGFDDEGRQFDARGNLRDWWTPADEKAFNERTQCLVDQYAQYTIVDDIKINSRLTLGEDLADLGGLVLALIAWKAETAAHPPAPLRDGFTPSQRFFIGFAQWACEDARPEQRRITALTDPHSPGRYRVNGLVVNIPEFEQVFACKPGQPMVAARRCKVW
jgi:endothelin-converting enzyme/putative endopeptidase